MEIVQSILTKNPCYKANKKITVKGLMLHSVGCPQPNASVFIKKWNSITYVRACVHGFIDANTGDVYQTLPWNHRGWHGGGSSNNTHIGVEMCESAYIKYKSGTTITILDKSKAIADTKRTYASAVELFAKLCKEYNLNPMTDIVSHSEGYRKGIASNHGDPEHLWKQLGLGYSMDTFRYAVKNKMGASVTPVKEDAQTTFIKGVQSACGAKVDGIAGTETLSKTITVSAKTNKKHAVVKHIQTYLNVLGYNCGVVDGVAGSKFTTAVKNFQKDHSCTVDGVITAGQKTWKKLLGIK